MEVLIDTAVSGRTRRRRRDPGAAGLREVSGGPKQEGDAEWRR